MEIGNDKLFVLGSSIHLCIYIRKSGWNREDIFYTFFSL